MSEQRKSEITVGTGVAEWGEELVAQWNVLGDTIARSVQQRSRLEQEHGETERVAQLREIERLRAALAASDARTTAMARESTVRLDATRREYEMKIASLQQGLEQPARAKEQPQTTAAQAPLYEQVQGATPDREGDREWEEEPASRSWRISLAGVWPSLTERWAHLRSGPYLIPVVGFLAGLAVMVALYPLLRRPSSGLAKEIQTAKAPPSTTGTADARQGRNPSLTANLVTPVRAEVGPATAEETLAASTTPAKPVPAVVEPQGYAVLLAGGRLLTPDKPGAPSALYEAQLALRAGYDSITVYQRNDRYMAAVLFSSREEAEKGLQSINADFDSRWKRTSSIVPVKDWCRSKDAREPVRVNGVAVAVWSCNKTPS